MSKFDRRLRPEQERLQRRIDEGIGDDFVVAAGRERAHYDLLFDLIRIERTRHGRQRRVGEWNRIESTEPSDLFDQIGLDADIKTPRWWLHLPGARLLHGGCLVRGRVLVR